jgi:hypothetical protein
MHNTRRRQKRSRVQGQRRTRSTRGGGGALTEESEYNLPPPPPPPTPAPLPPPPTLQQTAETMGNVAVSAATNLAADGVQRVASHLGIDPSKPAKETVAMVTQNVHNAVAALDTPEGQQLKEDTGALLADAVDVLKPSVEKGQEILAEGMTKLAHTGTSIAVTAANELPPVFLVNELSKFGTAAAQAGETVAKLTETAAEAGGHLEEKREEAESLWTRTKRLFGSMLEGVQSEVDRYGQQVSMQQLKQQGRMVGGRVNKSQRSFFQSHRKTQRGRKAKEHAQALHEIQKNENT